MLTIDRPIAYEYPKTLFQPRPPHETLTLSDTVISCLVMGAKSWGCRKSLELDTSTSMLVVIGCRRALALPHPLLANLFQLLEEFRRLGVTGASFR